MRRSLIIPFLFLHFFFSCNSNDGESAVPASENDVDAARNFIRSALDGNYEKAATFVIPDSTNHQYLDAFENNYRYRMSLEDKRGYRESSINIHAITPLSDSISIVRYSNSYKKKNDSLKLVRLNGQWLVDLKYSFPSTSDSLKK